MIDFWVSVGSTYSYLTVMAMSEAVAERYREATEEAKALCVFGSPTFVVDGEVIWGDDRLDDVLRWRERNRA